jgi:hypothetical protein
LIIFFAPISILPEDAGALWSHYINDNALIQIKPPSG